MRPIPPEISTGCPELDAVWRTYATNILERPGVLIPDSEDELNWHAFLGHSLDMQGFRAAEFTGVDALTRNAPNFVTLKDRGLGIPQLRLQLRDAPVGQLACLCPVAVALNRSSGKDGW